MLPVTDHRGKPVTLCGVGDDLPRTASLNTVPPEIRARIDDRLKGPRAAASGATSTASVVICLLVGLTLTPVLLKSGISIYVWAPMLAVLLVAIYAGVALVRRVVFNRVFAGQLVGAFLDQRRCPACGYDLAGAAADDDGCTVCPECGAAWSVSR